MIRIEEIGVSGISEAGPFNGAFQFKEGLQVVSAHNHFGKSLAVNSIAWCLGLERMFGLQDNDPSRFPVAVREVIDIAGQINVPIHSSQAAITLRRSDGAKLTLTRAIIGNPEEVLIKELNPHHSAPQTSKLHARKQTMKDAAAGLHNFLFEWCSLPRAPVVTNRGDESELYLENIAPLIYIDQNEGWTDLQALQVHRYGLLEVSNIAVEYLLGATASIQQRFARQTIAANESRLKVEASVLSSQIASLFEKQGWVIDEWSDHGKIATIATRWKSQSLTESIKRKLGVDLGEEQSALKTRAEKLRTFLTQGKLDPNCAGAPHDASQNVVNLKDQRHKRREELRVLRRQLKDQEDLLTSIENRLQSASDVLRLKTEGIGRIEIVECPTCHHSLEPSAFQLTSQSAESVTAHISALDRDRKLVISNISSCKDQIVRLGAKIDEVEYKLRVAERALGAVNEAVGTSREQLAKTASDLSATETEIERIADTAREILNLQTRIKAWIKDAEGAKTVSKQESDLQNRVHEFNRQLRDLLSALGHSAVLAQPDTELHLNEHYVPHLGPRRLRSLGSASDHSRLVAAYVLALAAASESVDGLHPGFVVLDEPLQQNPDEAHRNLFIEFLTSETAKALKVQTIVFTWLQGPELNCLREKGVNVVTPAEDHFLQLVESLPPPI